VRFRGGFRFIFEDNAILRVLRIRRTIFSIWDAQFKLFLDAVRARERWLKTRAFSDGEHCDDHCSMCGKEFCAVRTSRRIRELSLKTGG